jgi:RNA polymerase sigma factor (sigma-70 family)
VRRRQSSNSQAGCGILDYDVTTTVGDAELVHAARAGDSAALVVLLERHRPSLYAAALRTLGARADAQDAVQDIYLVALRRLNDLREPAAAAGWLHAIAPNACLMRLRETRRERPSDAPEPARGLDEVEEALDRLALGEWVWTAFAQLPRDLRATVMLRYFTRFDSYEDIAAALGVPVGTVRSRLNQATTRLGKALLESASLAHVDHVKLGEQCRRDWDAIVDEIVATGHAGPLRGEGFGPVSRAPRVP